MGREGKRITRTCLHLRAGYQEIKGFSHNYQGFFYHFSTFGLLQELTSCAVTNTSLWFHHVSNNTS